MSERIWKKPSHNIKNPYNPKIIVIVIVIAIVTVIVTVVIIVVIIVIVTEIWNDYTVRERGSI